MAADPRLENLSRGRLTLGIGVGWMREEFELLERCFEGRGRRAARNDGWISDLHTLDELREIVTRIRAYRKEYGREDAPLQIVAACKDAFDVDGYRRLEEVGVTHIQIMPWLFYGLCGDVLEQNQQGLRRFADDIIAVL